MFGNETSREWSDVCFSVTRPTYIGRIGNAQGGSSTVILVGNGTPHYKMVGTEIPRSIFDGNE